MWYNIKSNRDLINFMDAVCSFHDSCIKEMKYVSGAYVDDDLSMYPVNNTRILKVIIQRQFQDNSIIEMEFSGLKYLHLLPLDDRFTCEILDSTMILKDDRIYWCDCGGLLEPDLKNYDGTLICASKLRWRPIDKCMGKEEYYTSIV